jgi:putative phosphoesterase
MSIAARQVGLIADTHGVLRPEAIELLKESDFIVHAGDIGSAEVLRALAAIASVTAVRGNNDNGPWASNIPDTATLKIGKSRIYVIHDLAQLNVGPSAAGFQAVVSGHSHRPKIEWRDGVLFVNPGSAGPRRFNLPVSLGRLMVSDTTMTPELLEIALEQPVNYSDATHRGRLGRARSTR